MTNKSRRIILEFPDDDKKLQVLYMAHLMAENRQPPPNSHRKPPKWKTELMGQDGENLFMRVVRINPLECVQKEIPRLEHSR